MKPDQVECITCGVTEGWACVNRKDEEVSYYHLQRELLWFLRQENPWAQLLRKGDEGYHVEQTRLRTKRESIRVRELSLVEEIESTPEGRAALRMAEENSELRNLLDIAYRIIDEGEYASLTDRQAFAEGYTMIVRKQDGE
jgi:hypothetical protein